MEKVENVKILIADDTPANVKIIEKFIMPRGYEVIIANNGAEAVEMYKQHLPDIILMDIMMPVMDGYEATKEIKKLSAPHWVPLIFLSAKATIEDQIEGIKIGGDDYLTKPVDLRMLEAKLNAMMRIVVMQRELNRTHKELQNYYDQAEEEMELAKNLMENLSKHPEVCNPDMLTTFSSAAERISGDIIVYASDKNKRYYVMLADATGHGLTAAISQIPATQIFFQMVEQGHSVQAIAERINETLYKLLPPDRFVAATIVAIDFENKSIELWNGSNPRPVFVAKSGGIQKLFDKSNFALGIVGTDNFTTDIETYSWEEEGQLLIYSDGVVDFKNTEDEEFGFERLKNTVNTVDNANSAKTPFDRIISEMESFKDENREFDDVSLCAVECKV